MKWEDLTQDEKTACMSAAMLESAGVSNPVTQACAMIKTGPEGKKMRENVIAYRAANGIENPRG